MKKPFRCLIGFHKYPSVFTDIIKKGTTYLGVGCKLCVEPNQNIMYMGYWTTIQAIEKELK